MPQIYANADINGNIIGYYADDIHTPEQIPETAIQITKEEWQACLSEPDKWIVVAGALTLAPPPAPADLLAAAQVIKKAELSAAVGSKIVSGYQSTVSLVSTGLMYLYGTTLVDQQNMTASRVWSDNNPTEVVKYRPAGGIGRIDHTRDEFVAISDTVFDRVNWYLDQVDIYTPQIYAPDAYSVDAIVISRIR